MAPMSCMSHCSPRERIAVDRAAGEGRCRGSCRARTRRRATTASSTPRARVRWRWLRAAPSSAASPSAFLAKLGLFDCDRGHAHVGVLGDDRPARVADGLVGGGSARARLVDDDVLIGAGGGRAQQHHRAGDCARAAENLSHAGPTSPQCECGQGDAGTYPRAVTYADVISDCMSGRTERWPYRAGSAAKKRQISSAPSMPMPGGPPSGGQACRPPSMRRCATRTPPRHAGPVQARHVGVDPPRAGAGVAALAARPAGHDVAHPPVVVVAAAPVGDDLIRGPVRVEDRDRTGRMARRERARPARDRGDREQAVGQLAAGRIGHAPARGDPRHQHAAAIDALRARPPRRAPRAGSAARCAGLRARGSARSRGARHDIG